MLGVLAQSFTAEQWVLVIGAVGTQATIIIKLFTDRNGVKIDDLARRLDDLERTVKNRA